MPSVNTVMLIFALAALGILALSALVGFLAGLKRELKLMVVFVVLLGLVWLVLGNASNTLDAELPGFATSMLHDMLSGLVPSGKLGAFDTLRELVVQVVNGLASAGSLPANIADLLVEGTKTYALVMSVLDFIVRFVLVFVGTIVVYVLFILIRVLSFVIGSIYRLCTIKRRRRKRAEREAKRETGLEEGVVVVKSDIYDGEVVVTLSRNPKKIRKGKRRGWAAGVGLLRGALTVLLICVPITGLLSIVSEVEPETVDMVMDIMQGGQQSNEKVAQENNELLDWVFEFADAYDSGIVAEIIGSSEYFLGKELDKTLFDNLLKIETSTQTIYVREEIIKLVQIANILPEAYAPDKAIPIDVWSLSDVKQDRIFEILKDFKLLYEIMPVAIEFAGTLDMVKDLLEPSGQTLDGLSDVDWSHDLPLILDAVREALELGDITVNFDPLKLNSDVLRVVVANIGATDFIAKLMPIVINAALYLPFVENVIGEWPKENVIVTDGIVWENEFVNLVDVYALFQDLNIDLSQPLDPSAIISDSEKMEIVKQMLTHLFTSDLFIDVLLQVLDFAKEFQLGELGFEEFKNILKLTNLVAEDWEADVNTLVDMVVLVEELGVLSAEGIDFYSYDALRGLVTKLFDLMILSNKAGVNYQDPQQREVQAVFNEVKTLLVEAALRQFKLFDVEGKEPFSQFTEEERADIDWENEKQMLLNVLDVYEDLMEFLKTKDITFSNLGENINTILNYDETFDYLIDLLDALVDSDLAMTLIPYALDTYVVPIIEDFENQAGLPDGDKIDVTDKVNKDNLSEEIFNLIYILMDARELGLLGVVSGEMDFQLGALAYNPDSSSFNEMSDKLGYRPAADDLALVDIINRIFNSKLFEGNEAKLFRVVFALLLDTRVSKGAINAIEFNDPQVENSERNILINAINGLRPILTDPEFKIFTEDGGLNTDYFLEKEIALDVIDSARRLFTSELIAVLLPELYNQYLIPQGMIPEDFVELLNVQSLYLAEHKKDETYKEGLTGHELTQDIVTILSIAELIIDFDMLNILAEEGDILFENAADTFDRLFDLVLQLNILRDNGNKLASILVKMLLEVEIPVEDFEAKNVNWQEEVEGVKEIFHAVFNLLLDSEIEGYKKLSEILESPMDYLENFLVDANVRSLADILVNVSESKVLAVVALPLVNKFVPGMVEGIEEFTEAEYSGEMIVEDIHSFANILYNIADAQLMATIKVVLGELTELIPAQDQDAVIPLRHDLYANIIEELFGLNILQVSSVKEFIVNSLKDMLTDMDLSSVDPEGINFELDGQILAAAYLEFAEGFKQNIFNNLSVHDIVGIIDGNVEIAEFIEAANQRNFDAIIGLVENILSTTLVNEFALVVFEFVKGLVPEDLAFLLDVELTKGQFIADIKSVLDIVEIAVQIIKPAASELKANIEGLIDGTVDPLELELAINLDNLYADIEAIAHILDDLNLFDGRGKQLVIGAMSMLDVELTEEDLASVVWADEKDSAKLAVSKVVELLVNNDLSSLEKVLAITEDLSLENEDLINKENLLIVLDLVEIILRSEFVRSVFGPVYEQLLKETVEEILPAELQGLLEFNEEFTTRMLLDDVLSIISIARNALEFGALDIYRGGDIDWANTEPIENIIETIFKLNILNCKLDVVVDYVSESIFDLSELDVEAVRSGLVSDGEKLAEVYKLLADNILAKEWFPVQKLDDIDTLSLETLPLEELINYTIIEALGRAAQKVVSLNLVYEALPIAFDYAKGLLPEDLAFLLDVELSKEELQNDLYALIDAAEYAVDIVRPAGDEIRENIRGLIDGTVDPLELELAINLDNLYADIEAIAHILDDLNLFDGRGKQLVIGAMSMLDVELTEEDLASVVWADEKDSAKLAVYEFVDFLIRNEFNSLEAVMNVVDNLSLENTDLINTPNVLQILEIVDIVLNSEFVRSVFGPVYEQLLKESLPEVVTNILAFDENYSAHDLFADLSTIVNGLQSIISFELIEFINAEGILEWQNIDLVSDGIRQIFTIKLVEAKETEIVDMIAEMFSLTLHDVTDINWSQIGDKLGNAIEYIGSALQQANVLNNYADLETIGDNIEAFLTEAIFTNVIAALDELVDVSIIAALLPSVVYTIGSNANGPLGELLLLEGLTGADYVFDLNTIVSMLTDLNNMGLPGIIKSIMNNDIDSLEWRNTGNIVIVLEKLLQLRFWDNKQIEVIEAILEVAGIEVENLDQLDTAHENQVLLDVFREIVKLLDTLFAVDGTMSMSSINNFVETLETPEVLADLINKALLTISNLFEISSRSNYIRLLTVPAFNTIYKAYFEYLAGQMFGTANKSIANIDYYAEDLDAISRDLLRLSTFFKYLHETDLVNIVLLEGYQINYGKLNYLGEAFEVLFGLEILSSKEEVITNIVRGLSDKYVLTDGNIDFSNDGEKLNQIIRELIKFVNSGVVVINTLQDVTALMNGELYINLENLLDGSAPSIKLVFNVLEMIGEFSFLDEAFAYGHALLNTMITLPEGLEFLLDLGPNGAPGLVNDYLTLVQGIESIFDLQFTDVMFGKDIKLEFATTLSHFVESIFELDFLDGKGDKVLQYVADSIGYPELAELIPLNWHDEYKAFENIFHNIEGILYECGFFYLSDITEFANELTSLNDIIDLLSNNVLDMSRSIVRSIADSIVVQATLGAAAYFALPLVEKSLPEVMKPLARLDDITIGELVEDVMSIISIIANIDNFNLVNAVLFGDELKYDAQADKNPELYALQEVFELLFGLNYLNAKLDTIGEILVWMNPQFESIDFDFLQAEAVQQVYALRTNSSAMSNFAYDGVKLGQMYADFVETVVSDPKWSFNTLNDFTSIKILEDFYSRNIINGMLDVVASILDLNTLQAALPYVYELIGSMFEESEMGFIIDYILETPADELQADIVTIISAFKAIADNHNFIYEEELRAFLNGEGLAELNFNLSIVQALPNILDDLSKLNVLNYIKGDRLVEIVQYVLDTMMPSFDQARVDWATLSTLFDYLEQDSEELTSFVQIFQILAEIIYEDFDYEEFKPFYNDLMNIRISKNEKLLNADVVNSVLDILDILVNSTIVESFFYAVYDNFLASIIENMAPVNELLDVYAYASVRDLQEDLTTIVNILREAVDFDVLGIVFFEREINWLNTTPVENIFKHLFGLNYLDTNAGLPLVVEFLSSMLDLSELNIESVGSNLEADAELIALAYRTLATEIFKLDIFPVHSMADLNEMTFDLVQFLTEDILMNAVLAVEYIVSTNLVKEILSVAYYLAQTNLPDNLFFLVSNSLSGDDLQEDALSLLEVVRELIRVEAYNAIIEDAKISLVDISDHINKILDILLHTNILSADRNSVTVGLFNLLGIELSADMLENVEYEADFGNIYNIIESLEAILIRTGISNHLELLTFVSNIDTTKLLDEEYEYQLVSENNLAELFSIIRNVLGLSIVPAIFEPVYNTFVDLSSFDPEIQPFLDITEYPVELFLIDAESLVYVLEQLVEFDILNVLRGYAIDWDNIDPIENIITTIFALNYLDVKVDDIIAYVTNNIFDLSKVDVNAINLAEDGKEIASAYRLLAQAILSQNWFPIQFTSDFASISLETLPLDKILTKDVLTEVVKAIEHITLTSLVYEIVPVLYSFAQTIVPDDLYFLVSETIEKSDLAEDVASIINVLEFVVDTEIYNAFVDKHVPLDGIIDNLVSILQEVFGLNLFADRLNDIVYEALTLAGIEVDYFAVLDADINADLTKIYNVLYSIDDIINHSEFDTHTELLDFINNLDIQRDIIDSERVLNDYNLLCVIDALRNIASLELLLAVFEPVYNQFVLEGMSDELYGILEISEYPAELFVEDLNAILSVLESLVEFDTIGVVFRGHAFKWTDIESIENVFKQVFGLNFLEVKLDNIVEYVSENMIDLSDLDVTAINLENDGENFANAYRILAENVLTKTWFPVQFLDDFANITELLTLKEFLNVDTLDQVVNALNEILTTTLVYEAVPVFYLMAQENVADELFFLVSNSLTKQELADDIQSVVLVLREAIQAEVFNILLGEGIELEGLADHIGVVLEILFGTNLLGKDLPHLFSGIFQLVELPVEESLLEDVDFDHDITNIRSALNSLEQILVNAKFVTHLDVLEFMSDAEKMSTITANQDILNNNNLTHLLDALESLVGLELILAVFEPVYNTFVLENVTDELYGLLEISEYPAELFVEDLQTIISGLRDVVAFDVLSVLRRNAINWNDIESVENVITKLFSLNYLEVKLDDILAYVTENMFDLSLVDATAIDLEADGAKIAKAYRILAETILTKSWFPIQYLSDLSDAETRLELSYLLTKDVLNNVVDALNEILTTSLVYEATAVGYDLLQNNIPADLFFLAANSLSKEELASDIQSIVLVLKEAIEAEAFNIILGKGIEIEGLADHVAFVIETLFATNIIGKDLSLVLSGAFGLIGVDVSEDEFADVNIDNDLYAIRRALNSIEDIVLNALAKENPTHLDVFEFIGNIQTIYDITKNQELLNNTNLIHLLEALDAIVGLDLLLVLFEPMYNTFVLENVSDDLYGLLEISEYPAESFVEDLQSIVSLLVSVVRLDVLGALRGEAIYWANITDVENVINKLFGLNFLEVKLDNLVEYFDGTFADLGSIDVDNIDLESDGNMIAAAYRMIAENILTQSWFPVEFYNDFFEETIFVKEIFNIETLNLVITALNNILKTSLVYEATAVGYEYLQTVMPNDLYFLVEQPLSKDELAEDVQSIVLVLREVVNAEAFNLLFGEGIAINGISIHVANILNIIYDTNMIGNNLPAIFSSVFELIGVAIDASELEDVKFKEDLDLIRTALISLESLVLNALDNQNATHLDVLEFINNITNIYDITKDQKVLNNVNLTYLLDALQALANLDLVLAVFEPVYNTLVIDMIPADLYDIFEISEYPAELFVEDLGAIIGILRDLVKLDVLGALRNVAINWSDIASVEDAINKLFSLNFLEVKLDNIVDYVTINYVDLSLVNVEDINLEADGAKFAMAYRIIAENVLTKAWFPMQFYSDFFEKSFLIEEIFNVDTLDKVIDALNEILTTTLVYEATAVGYDYVRTIIPTDLYFLVENELDKAELAEDVQSLVLVLREAVKAEAYNVVFDKGVPVLGLAGHVSTIIDTLLKTNMLGQDYPNLFANIFELIGLEVSSSTLESVLFEDDFARIYQVLENVEDILLLAGKEDHIAVIDLTKELTSVRAIINNETLVTNDTIKEVLDSLHILIDLSMVPALYETIYDQYVPVDSFVDSVLPLLDISNYDASLFVEDAHALVYVLEQLVEFGGIDLYRDAPIDWTNTLPIENIINKLFSLNYINVKLPDIINLVEVDDLNTSLIDVELLRANLVADGAIVAGVYKEMANRIFALPTFPGKTYSEIKGLGLADAKAFYTKEIALDFIEIIRPLIATTSAGELFVVAYDFVQTKAPEDFKYLVEQTLDKDELRADANSLLDVTKVLIESDLIKLAAKKDVPLEGISTPINEIINIVAHTNVFGKDLARIVEGTFALAGFDLSYDELAAVDYEHDLLVVYDIVEASIDLLMSCNTSTVLGAYSTLRNALASGRAVLRNTDLVNETNAIKALDIASLALDLEVARVIAKPAYSRVINALIDAIGLPEELADTTRYDVDDLFFDARKGIEIVKELVYFGAIGYYQEPESNINWANTLPIKNIITNALSTRFLDEFDNELIRFVGDKVGFDLVTGIDIDSINWVQDASVYSEAYEIVALGILNDPEFTVKSYSDIRTFDFNARDYAKERYALTGIDALDLCIDTTLFDAYGLTVLSFINNYLPESLQFVIAETTIDELELRADAHAGLYLAELAINEGYYSVITTKDCDLIKPDFYKEVIRVLFDLNLTKDSDIRVRLINVVLEYVDLEQIDSISDWDNEETVYLALVDLVCEFAVKNDLVTLKKAYSFLANRTFMSGSFLTDANILEILDIADEAIKSEVVSKVSASVYTKVVDIVPYEGVRDLVAFGTGSRDYTKEGFYNDLPQFIDIARDIVNMSLLNVLRDGAWHIASADTINALIDKVVALNLFNNRLDLFFGYAFDVLSIDVDLNGIDWDNEVDVLQNVISLALTALQDSGMVMLSDAKALVNAIISSPISFIKNNRNYANLTNAYVALDVLEELANSEVYMRSLLPVYNRFSHVLPQVVTNNVDLSTYPEAELRIDYPNILAIVRKGLDGQLYRALIERRGWSFPVEAQVALEEIIALACDLNFTARYTEGVFRMAFDVLGISNMPHNLSDVDLREDKAELVSIVGPVREIWLGTNHIRPNIPMLANKDLFVEISFVLDTLLDTTMSFVFVPWIYESYVVDIISSLPTLDGKVDFSKLESYRGSEVIELCEDGITVFNEMIAMNVFGMSGIDFTDNQHVKTMLDILLKHVGFSARIENYLHKLAERSYLMGVIPVSYDQVTSTRTELSIIKNIAVDTLNVLRNYASALTSRNFATLTNGACEADVLAIIDKLGESVLLNTSFLPLFNGFGDVVVGPEFADIYQACQVASIPEFKDAVAGAFDILGAAEKVGILDKQVQYKNTEGFKELFMFIEVSPFVKGQEGVLAEFVLKYTDYIDHNDVDLININWTNEYQYLYEFLDKANAPLNMEGIVITDYKALLDNPVFMKEFTEALRAFAPSELMVEMFMPVYDDIVSAKFSSVKDLLDYSHLETLDDASYALAIRTEYESLLDLAVAISESGIMGSSDLINVNKLLAVYDIVFSLEGTKNNKADIFEKLSDKLPSFGDSELVIPDDVNWDTEIPAIRGIFASLNNFADVDGNIDLNEIGNIITESTDVKAFEELLTAINQSVIYRAQLFDTLYSEINNVSPDGDIVISKYLTTWFKDQETNGMASIAEWDSEMIYLARILTIINYMRQNGGFSDLGHMTLGQDVALDAKDIPTDEFNVADYGLKQLLELMSASKSFTLTALNSDLEALLIDNAENDGLIETEKHLTPLSDAEWDAEIEDLIRLIHIIQVLEILDSSLPVSDHIMLCTEAEIEELLVAFNHCDAIREILPDMISETLDSADAADWKSEWLMAQVGVDAFGNNKPMAPVSEWDYEAKELAAIISLIDTFDFSKGISTYTQEDIDHLRDLLHEMNHDKSLDVSYIIQFLNDNVLGAGLIQTTKRFETPTAWDMAKWDLELDNMVDVIQVAIDNGLFAADSGSALANMEQAEIESILKEINESEIMRTVLPDLVYNAVQAAEQDSWLSTDNWLQDQVGQTDGVNNPVESKDDWDAEIEKYAFIISKSSQFDFANLDLSDNDKLDDLKEIMNAMNDTKSFTLDPVVDIINDLLGTNGYNVDVIGVVDGANKASSTDINGTNKDEWATEINVLFDILKQMNSLGTINSDTIKNQSSALGELLDAMETSYLFGNDVRDDEDVTTNDNVFNALVIDVLTTSNIIDNGTNGGFINKTEALEDDWTRYNWTSELEIIGAYDATSANQTDEFISMAQTSEIIKKYFDIAGEINSRLDITFSIYGQNFNLQDVVIEVNGGPLTNADLLTRSWADELDDIETLTNAINTFETNNNPLAFIASLNAMRDHPTLAGGIADNILDTIESL